MAHYVLAHRLIVEDPNLTPSEALDIAMNNPIL
jgi:hypothetical protein